MTVKRYGTSSMPCDSGIYVLHAEYEALEAQIRGLMEAQALVIDYVSALLTYNVDGAGDATRRMTDYALDHATEEPK